MGSKTAVPLAALALAGGCKKVEEASDAIDRDARDLWRLAMSAEDAELLALVQDLAGRTDVEALKRNPERGEVSRLDEADIADLEFDVVPDDPGAARGFSFLNAYDCDQRLLLEIVTYKEQNDILDQYDTYERVFRGGDEAREAFLDGDTDRLVWDGTLSASNIAYGSYEYDFISEMRTLRDGGGEAAGWLVRNWMPRPARLDNENKSLTQDYQFEAFVPAGDGAFIHFYPYWREMDLGSLGTMESDVVAQTTFYFVEQFDRKVAKACEDGLPTD